MIFACRGEETVSVAESQVPDLVLMDLNLSGIDGCEATRRIKAASATQDIPVVALSGHAEEDKGAAFRAAGCCGYVRKPIRVRELSTMVNNLLAAGAPAARAEAKGGSSR